MVKCYLKSTPSNLSRSTILWPRLDSKFLVYIVSDLRCLNNSTNEIILTHHLDECCLLEFLDMEYLLIPWDAGQAMNWHSFYFTKFLNVLFNGFLWFCLVSTNEIILIHRLDKCWLLECWNMGPQLHWEITLWLPGPASVTWKRARCHHRYNIQTLNVPQNRYEYKCAILLHMLWWFPYLKSPIFSHALEKCII